MDFIFPRRKTHPPDPEADRLPLSIAPLAAVIVPTVAFVAAWEVELGAKWIRG